MTLSIPFGILPAMNNADRILSIALKEFAVRGYEAVGVQEIVDAAGVTKPTLYHYFGGKQGVLEELIKRKTSGFLQSFSIACTYQHDLTYTLEKILRSVLSFAVNDPVFFRYYAAMRYAPAKSTEKECVALTLSMINSQLLALFTASGFEHGNIRGKEEVLAVTFWGFCVEVALLLIEGKLTMEDDLAYQMKRYFEFGIYS